MKPKSQRLIILFFFLTLLGLSTFLVLKSLEDNIVYFYSPTDINKKILSNEIDLSKRIRLGGLVKENSILKEGKKLKGQKLLVPMIDKTIKVTVSDTIFLDKENERING